MKPAVVIVLYNPNSEDIDYVRTIGILYDGYIVDNSSIKKMSGNCGKLHYICNRANLGIAKAQNIAIERILQTKEYTHIVFFDQDTRVEPDYVQRIVDEYIRTEKKIVNLASLGPTVRYLNSNETYHSVVHKDLKPCGHFIKRSAIISSGSCIAVKRFRNIGLNDEGLFIDFVDFEWCWRAESKGFVCGITDNVSIRHNVGRKELKFPFGYRVIVSAPFRYYYQYRNHLLLCRRKYVPRQWKMATAIKHIARFLYFPIFLKNGMKYMRYMIKGFCDGVTQKVNHLN